MNKVEKIKAEIERLIKEINLFTPNEDGKNDTYECGRLAMASDILGIIDSLEEEPVSNDLEEAAMQYAKSKHKDTTLQQIVSWDFKAGAQWQKEQMIAKACEWLENYFKGVSSGTVYLEDFKKAIKE